MGGHAPLNVVDANQRTVLELPADFGDGKTLLSILQPEGQGDTVAVILHGSYGCANFQEGNKYAHLARIFAREGVSSCLVETSRKCRDRQDCSTDHMGWIGTAFRGKTFAQELQEVCAAIMEIARLNQEKRLWIVGFSLGGILAYLALSCALREIPGLKGEVLSGQMPPVDALILAGVGARTNAPLAKGIPIMSDLPRAAMDPIVGKSVLPGRLISLYGSDDDTFTEDSCRLLLDYCGLPKERKFFHVLDGVDHRFRLRDKAPLPLILEEMVKLIITDASAPVPRP